MRVAVINDVTTTDAGIPEDSLSFGCALGDGLSAALFPSTYTLTFSLVGSNGVIASVPPIDDLVIMSDKTTTVPSVIFNIP